MNILLSIDDIIYDLQQIMAVSKIMFNHSVHNSGQGRGATS